MLDLTTALYGAVAALAAFYVLKYLYWWVKDRGKEKAPHRPTSLTLGLFHCDGCEFWIRPFRFYFHRRWKCVAIGIRSELDGRLCRLCGCSRNTTVTTHRFTCSRKLFIDRGDDIETYASIPLLGVPKDKIKSLHTLTVDDVRKKGPIYRRVNALKPWAGAELVVADPNMLKGWWFLVEVEELWKVWADLRVPDIFVGKNWQKFDRGHPVAESFFPYSGGLIHARNDDTWRELRAIYDRTFSTVNVRKLMPIMIDLRDILMTQLEKGTKEHPEGIDLYSYFHAFTFDMITRLAFGAQVNAQTTETGMHYAKQFEKWQENATVMFLIRSLAGKWAFPMISKIVDDWKANGECMYGLLDDERDRVKRGEGRPSILNDLYTLIKEEKMSKNVTEDVIRSANMTLLFGFVRRNLRELLKRQHSDQLLPLLSTFNSGHDTTAALLGFLAYELSKRPDIQAQIRAEVKEVFGNNNIDNLEELEKCKVLTASIKETLRGF